MSNALNHLAIIADGNGRWAERRQLTRSDGHDAGMHKIEDLMHWCVDLDIPVLSVYCFSKENWTRPKEEVDSLISLANYYFDRYKEFAENNIRVVVSGSRKRLEADTLERIERVQRETAHCTGLTLNLCANYSGREEIAEAVQAGARAEEEITAFLYQNLPEPDLIIRTGGHKRMSNFLMWQSAYSELYFTDTYFPDFSFAELRHAVKEYTATRRKYGGL